MRIINPHSTEQLTSEELNNVKELIQFIKDNNSLLAFADYMYEMKVCGYEVPTLTASKIVITAPGVIDIQMYPPSDLKDGIPGIPQQREF